MSVNMKKNLVFLEILFEYFIIKEIRIRINNYKKKKKLKKNFEKI